MHDLTGRTILITGASSGLGRHFALIAAKAGAKVAVAARRTDRLATLVGEIGAAALALALGASGCAGGSHDCRMRSRIFCRNYCWPFTISVTPTTRSNL